MCLLMEALSTRIRCLSRANKGFPFPTDILSRQPLPRLVWHFSSGSGKIPAVGMAPLPDSFPLRPRQFPQAQPPALISEDSVVMQHIARTLFFGTLACLAFGLPGRFLPEARGDDTPPAGRAVYLAGGLTDQGLITL